MMSLKNKVVVVTGASSGIGKSSAIKFAKKGVKLIIAARRFDKLKELQDYISSFNKNCVSVKTDITDEKDVINLFKVAEKKFGSVDILINAAGKGLKSEFYKIEFDEWQSVVKTNYTSVFLCTKEASKLMMRKKTKGHIITISSLAGIFNVPNYSAYCSTKHAVTSFNSSIKWELKKFNIRISTIHPYKVNTEFFNNYNQKPNSRKMLSSDDVADFIIALAEQNFTKQFLIRIINLFKRMYKIFI